MVYFILGSCLGSFLPVLAREWSIHQIQWFRRSRCDRCLHTLSPMQLIPILSSVIFRWRCKFCGQTFSSLYFFFELISGILYYFWATIFPENTLLHLLILTLLITAAFIDWFNYWLPDLILACLLALSLYLSPDWSQICFSIFISISLSIIYFLSSDRIGFADIKLLSILALLIPICFYPLFIMLACLFAILYFLVIRLYYHSPPYIAFAPWIFLSYLFIMTINRFN